MLVGPSLVDVDAGDPSWSRVEVLVRAPAGKVDTPVVQRKRDVADGMREIESDETALQASAELAFQTAARVDGHDSPWRDQPW